jgi:hypothetical protein
MSIVNIMCGRKYNDIHCKAIFHGIGYYLSEDDDIYFLFKDKDKQRFVRLEQTGEYIPIVGFRINQDHVINIVRDNIDDLRLISLHNTVWDNNPVVVDTDCKFEDTQYGDIMVSISNDRKIKLPPIYEEENDNYKIIANSIDLKWNQLVLTDNAERVRLFTTDITLLFF